MGGALVRFVLKHSSIVLFVMLFCVFGGVAPRFFAVQNVENILVNASYIGIVAVGITMVLLTGGIDLSVGANMYLSCIVAGLLLDKGMPVWVAAATCITIGATIGALNAFFIVQLRAVAFVVTLAMMIAVRGIGLYGTRSIPVDFPESITLMATVRVFGIAPLPIVLFGLVAVCAHVLLSYTTTGRHLYAVGEDVDKARTAGIATGRILALAYVLCGVCAAGGGLVSVGQVGIVKEGLGQGDEFDAIAAAVLGGTSLFGGVGNVLPGTVLGTILIQTVQAGLVFTGIDLYIQPLVMAGIIFLAVFIDSMRIMHLRKARRRHIMKREEPAETGAGEPIPHTPSG